MKKKKTIKRIAIVSTIVISFFVYGELKKSKERVNSISCANHFIQIKMGIIMYQAEHPNFQFPDSNNLEIAFKGIIDFADNKYGLSCPESYKNNQDYGYVFIGANLKNKDIIEQDALILFCPSSSHRKSAQHSHAFHGEGNHICYMTNKEMINLLESALTKHENGKIEYTKSSLEILKNEIMKRKEKS